MGYNTDFKGELKFKNELSREQLAYLNTILGEFTGDHKEWSSERLYIQLDLTKDFSGIQWDGCEKTYDMDEAVRVVIKLMKQKYPDFELNGEFFAQGEEIADVWKLVVHKNEVKKVDIPITGNIVTCPECDHEFIYEPKKEDY